MESIGQEDVTASCYNLMDLCRTTPKLSDLHGKLTVPLTLDVS